MMKKQYLYITKFLFIAVLIISAVTIGSFTNSWANESIKVGIFQNKPIVFFEDGPKGLFVEILDHVAEKEGWKLDYVTCELKECFNLLKSHELDLMTSLGVSPGRSEFLKFSKESIWTFWGTIYSHDFHINSVLDLKDKKIGVRRKNKITLELQKMLKNFNIPVQYVEFDNYEAAFQAFLAGSLDAIAVNNTYGFDKQKDLYLHKTPIVFSPFSAYFAAPKNGRHNDKLAIIDGYVKKLRKEKQSLFDAFEDKWFGKGAIYWTGKKIGIISAIFIFATVIVMAIWRFRSIVRINQGLYESEARFRLLLDSLDALVYVADMDTYEVLFINEYGRKMFGDITGKICWQSIQKGRDGPCDICTNKYLLNEDGKPGNVYTWEFQNTVTGKWFYIHDRAIKWSDGRIVRMEIATDISEKKQMDEVLQKSKEEWEKTFDSMSDIVTIQDKDMRIVRCNKAAGDIFQVHPGALVGKYCYEVFRGSNQPCPDCPELMTIMDSEIHSAKISHQNLGKVFHVISSPMLEADGELTHIVHIARDITEQQLLEEELHESQIRLSLLVDQSPMAIMTWDKNFRVVDWNKASEKMFGYSREEATGKHAGFIVPVEYRKHVDKIMQSLLELEGGKRSTNENITKDGDAILCEWFNAPLVNNQNEVVNVLSLVQDITEQKKLQDQVQQTQKMQAMGNLAGGIAHDFNNILSIILGYSQLAKLDFENLGHSEENIDQILKAGARASDLVKQILAFSRKTEHKLQPIAPHVIVKEVLKMLRASLPTTITIEENIDPQCGVIQAEPTQIHQILMNLCTNAQHAMENEKGVLSVSLFRKEIQEEQMSEPGVSPGTFVVLAVGDTGHGMDEKTQAKIFEPYFTTKEIGEGTGLGLAVIHGIVQDYKGFVKVESELGKGTTFHVHIPVIEQASEELNEFNENEVLTGVNERILFVDDERDIINMNKKVLEGLDYQVEAISDSLNALEKFRSDPDKFDLLITDQTMPNLTGFELSQEVLQIKPDMPIILCTGYSSVISEKDALAIGIKKYVKKPIDRKILALLCKEVLDGD